MIGWIDTLFGWYEKRSTWIKLILFFFVFIVIAILTIISFFLSGKNLSLKEDNSTELLREVIEEDIEEDLKTTRKMDTKIARKILEEEEKRIEIEKEKMEGRKRRDEILDEIDRAIDFASVDDTLDKFIQRKTDQRERDD